MDAVHPAKPKQDIAALPKHSPHRLSPLLSMEQTPTPPSPPQCTMISLWDTDTTLNISPLAEGAFLSPTGTSIFAIWTFHGHFLD